MQKSLLRVDLQGGWAGTQDDFGGKFNRYATQERFCRTEVKKNCNTQNYTGSDLYAVFKTRL